MRTIIVGASWITKYFIADTLYNDSNFEQYIQVISPEPLEEFFSGFPKLQEFQGDERLSYIPFSPLDAIKQGISLEGVDSIYYDSDETQGAQSFFEHIQSKGYDKRIVLASTWEVYGWKGRSSVPIDPRDECNPEIGLGAQKLLQEQFLKQSKLNYVILRFATVFGPYMPHDHELVKMCTQAMYGEDIVITGIPSRWLDMVYITEVLPIIYKSLSMGGIDRQVFNVGGYHDLATPEQPKKNLVVNEKRITDIVRSMRHLMDSTSPYTFEPGVNIPQGKGYHSQLDIETTQQTFGYYPNFDSIKLSQFIWWVESLVDKSRRRTHDMEELYPSLDPKFMDKIDVQKVGESMNISQEQFNSQLEKAQTVARKDAKIEDL